MRGESLSDASLTGGNAERRSKGSGRQPKNAQTALKALLRANGLSLVLLMLFIVLLGGQSVSGMYEYNEERSEHGERPLGLAEYLATGHFLEATAENWESEFLQMAAYVLLTAWLFQKGSSESKKLDEKEGVDRDLRQSNREGAPGPVRHGGWQPALVRALAVDRLPYAVPFVFYSACRRRGGGIQRRAARSWRTGRVRARVHRHRPVLVRINSELAKRIFRFGWHGGVEHLSAGAWLARIETRRCATLSDWVRVRKADACLERRCYTRTRVSVMGGAGPSTRFGFAGLARRRRLIGDSQDHGLSGDDPEPSIKSTTCFARRRRWRRGTHRGLNVWLALAARRLE